MGKERFLRELGPSPETAKTSDTEIEETMGEENKGKSANAEEATEPMGDAKLKAKIKAESEADKQKAEAERPKGMPWPLSILNK